MDITIQAKINQNRNQKIKRKVVKIILSILVALFSFTTILPFFWMISASLKYEIDVFTFPIQWLPEPGKWNAVSNYIEVWSGEYSFGLYYRNTIKIAVLATIFQVLFSSMAGYAFAKIDFKFKNLVFPLFLSVMMIPDQVTLVPRFMLARWFNLYDTHAIIILLLSFSVYGTFLMRQHMVTIPDALSESARIDGASHWTIFSRIILPISKPAIITLAIIKFVWTWNDYQTPLVFLKSRDLYTIQLGMRQFANESGTYYSLQMAAAVCAILPLIIIFLLGQKYIVEGMTAGAVKG